MMHLIYSALLSLAIVLVPFAFLPGTTKPAIEGKLLVISVAVGLLLFWLVYQWLSRGKLIWKKSLLNIGVLVFTAVVAISTFLSISYWESFWGSASNGRGLFAFLVAAGLYLLLMSDLRGNFKNAENDAESAMGENDKRGKKISSTRNGQFLFLGAVLLGIGLTVLVSLLQVYQVFVLPWEFTRTTSFNMVGSVHAASILAAVGFVMSMAMVLLVNEKGFLWLRLLSAAVLVMTGVFLVFVSLPVAWLVTAIGIGALILGLLISQRSFNRIVFLGLLLLIALVLAFPGISKITLPSRINVVEISPSATATYAIVGKAIEEEPLIGKGLGSFPFLYTQNRAVTLNNTAFWPVRFGGGSSFFTTLVGEIGYIGIAAWLGMLGIAFLILMVELFKRKSQLALVLMGGLAGIAGASFVYPFTITYLLITFVLLGLVTRLSGSKRIVVIKRKEDVGISSVKEKFVALAGTLAALIVILGSLTLLYLEILHYSAASLVARAGEITVDTQGQNMEPESIQQQQEAITRKLTLLSRAYNLEGYNSEILRQFTDVALLQAGLITRTEKKLGTSTANNLISSVNQAIQAARRATEIEPVDSFNWANLGKVYENLLPLADLGTVKLAVEAYGEARKRDPNNPELAVSIGRINLFGAVKADQRRAILQQSPKADEDELKKLADQRDKMLEEAIAAFKEAVQLKADYTPAHFHLVQVYDALGQLDNAIQSATALLRNNPQDPGLWFQLGLLAFKKQDYTNAQAALGQAVELFPDYSNARYFLGLVYSNQNQNKLALEQFRKIAELNPDNNEIPKIINNLELNKPPLTGIVPPAQPPLERTNLPVEENTTVDTPQIEAKDNLKRIEAGGEIKGR